MNKAVLITGTSRGLGKHLASVFGGAGYSVLPHRGRVDGDLRDGATLADLASLAVDYNIDILINNAGVYINKPFSEMTAAEFKEVIDINLLSVINLTNAVWPIFQRKKAGTVVFINSVAGRNGSPGESAYCASKFGLKGFADSLRYDGLRDGVRVVSVFLGAMETDMTKNKGKDPKHNIDPLNVAKIILNLCRDYTRAEITEITIDKIPTKIITDDQFI